MKSSLLIILLLIVSLSSNAQKMHITDTTNFWWITGHDSSGDAFYTGYVYVDSGYFPTGYSYTGFRSSTSSPGYIDGVDYIREDTVAGIVYLFDYFRGFDRVLYKYNLNIGDTVHLNYNISLEADIAGRIDSEMTDSVINIDSILINGYYYKIFSLVEIDTFNTHLPSYNPYLTYIEGIGSVYDPMNAQITAMYFGDTAFLQCFYNNGVAYTIKVSYTYPTYGDTAYFVNNCADLPHLGVTAASPLQEMSVYPNPAISEVNIINAQGCNVSIFNILGEKVFEDNITNNKQTENISNLLDGVYIVELMNSNGGEKKIRLLKE